MLYYDNSFKLRNSDPTDYNLLHSRVDSYMQEVAKTHLPYSFWHCPSNDSNASLVLLRSAVPLGLPGEKQVELTLEPDSTIRFKVRACFNRNQKKKTDHGYIRVESAPTQEEMLQSILPEMLNRNGLELIHPHVTGSSRIYLHKKGAKWWVRSFDLTIAATVIDPSLVEKLMTEGLGRKRIYGFGMLRDVEIF